MAKEKVEIRKAPKFLPFMLVFAGLGLVLAIVLNSFISDEDRTAQPILGYLIGYLSAIGAVLGLVVALVFDAISRARIKTLDATRSR